MVVAALLVALSEKGQMADNIICSDVFKCIRYVPFVDESIGESVESLFCLKFAWLGIDSLAWWRGDDCLDGSCSR